MAETVLDNEKDKKKKMKTDNGSIRLSGDDANDDGVEREES